MSNTALNRTMVVLMTNKSGGAVAQGDVVIIDATTAAAFTTTTTGGYAAGAAGVVMEPNGIADNGVGLVAFSGWVPKINLSSSASLGDLFKTHTVAKQAVRHAAPAQAGDFGQVLGTGTSPAALLRDYMGAAGAGTGDFVGPGSSVAGNIVTFADTTGKLGADGGLPPAMVQLGKVTVGAGGASTIAFSTIPGTYNNLILTLQGAGDAAAAEVDVRMTFNADGGNNYSGQTQASTSTNIFYCGTYLNAAYLVASTIPGANAGVASTAGQTEIKINNYAGGFHKSFRATGYHRNGTLTTDQRISNNGGSWQNTAAITSITLAPSSGKFVENTVAILYGIK